MSRVDVLDHLNHVSRYPYVEHHAEELIVINHIESRAEVKVTDIEVIFEVTSIIEGVHEVLELALGIALEDTSFLAYVEGIVPKAVV